MSNLVYPTDLTDRQWDCIKDLVPAAKPGGRPRSLDPRQVVNAIFYLLVTGCQWRALPHDYPKWQSVYTYFRTWREMAPGNASMIPCGRAFATAPGAISIRRRAVWIVRA
jgi:transposase